MTLVRILTLCMAFIFCMLLLHHSIEGKESTSGPIDYIRKSYSDLGFGGAQKSRHKGSRFGELQQRTENAYDKIRGTGENIKGTVKRKGEQLGSQAENVYESAKDQLRSVGEDIGERGTEAWHRLSNQYKPLPNRWEKMKEHTSDLYQELREKSEDALTTAKNRFNTEDMVQNVKEGYSSVKDRAREPLKAIPEQMHRVAHKIQQRVPLRKENVEPKPVFEWLTKRLYDVGDSISQRVQKVEEEESNRLSNLGRKNSKIENDTDKRLKQIWEEKMQELKEAFEEFKEEANFIEELNDDEDHNLTIEHMEARVRELESLLEKERFRLDFFRKEVELERRFS